MIRALVLLPTFGMLAALLAGLTSAQAVAPYFYWSGSVSTDWHDEGNWTIDYRGESATNLLPTIADVAYVNEVPANIPTLSTVESALTLRVAYSAGTTGVLNIIEGANLTVASNYDRVGNDREDKASSIKAGAQSI